MRVPFAVVACALLVLACGRDQGDAFKGRAELRSGPGQTCAVSGSEGSLCGENPEVCLNFAALLSGPGKEWTCQRQSEAYCAGTVCWASLAACRKEGREACVHVTWTGEPPVQPVSKKSLDNCDWAAAQHGIAEPMYCSPANGRCHPSLGSCMAANEDGLCNRVGDEGAWCFSTDDGRHCCVAEGLCEAKGNSDGIECFHPLIRYPVPGLDGR